MGTNEHKIANAMQKHRLAGYRRKARFIKSTPSSDNETQTEISDDQTNEKKNNGDKK